MANEQYIRIRGNMAEYIEERVRATAPLSEVMPFLETRMPVTLPPLPRSSVWAHWDENQKVLVVLCEKAAGMRTINRSGDEYKIAMPWSYFLFTLKCHGDMYRGEQWSIDLYQLYFSKTKFQDDRTQLIVAPMNNIDEDGNICFGSTAVSGYMSMADRLDQTVNDFYRAEFNWDLSSSSDINLENWATESLLDINCYNRWPNWSNAVPFSQIAEENTHMTRPLVAVVDDPINPIQVPFSFGLAEEYYRRMNITEFTRMLVAVEKVKQERATEIPEPVLPVMEVMNDSEELEEDAILEDEGVAATW